MAADPQRRWPPRGCDRARLVNAAGPWVGIVAETILRMPGRPPVRLVKGSHIVVRQLFDHGRGYIFQNPDRRIVFALPFAQEALEGLAVSR